MDIEKLNTGKKTILRDAIELALLYFPIFFMAYWFEEFTPLSVTVGLPIVSGLLCGCIYLGNQFWEGFAKWLLSIPFSLLFGGFLYLNSFSVRLFNYLNPGYGRFTGGAGFAFIFELGSFVAMHGIFCLIGILIAALLRDSMDKYRSIIQAVILPVLCLLLLLGMVYLYFAMPSMYEIIYDV